MKNYACDEFNTSVIGVTPCPNRNRIAIMNSRNSIEIKDAQQLREFVKLLRDAGGALGWEP